MARMTANMIRTMRHDLEMTQVQFAKRQHVSYSLVTKWETGDRHPSGADLFLLQGCWLAYLKRVAAQAKAKRARKART